jgi:carboxyl-terminal processing protease
MSLPALFRTILLFSPLLMGVTAAAADEAVDGLSPAQLKKISEVYAVIKREYVDATDDDKLLNDAIRGMVSGLDPHSSYLDYAAMKDNGVQIGRAHV